MTRSCYLEANGRFRRRTRALAVAAAVFITTAAFAVTVPYSDNFDSYPTGAMPDNFIAQTSGGGVFYYSDWTI